MKTLFIEEIIETRGCGLLELAAFLSNLKVYKLMIQDFCRERKDRERLLVAINQE